MTRNEIDEMKEKIRLLLSGSKLPFVFDANTGRVCLSLNKDDKHQVADLEESIPLLRRPKTKDSDIRELTDLVIEINDFMKRYIQEYGVFPSELCIQ